MEWVKSIFGIILFTAALYFLKNAFPLLKAPLNNSVANYTFAAGLLIAGIVVGAVHLSYHHPHWFVRFRKTVGVFCTVVGLYVIFGSLTTVEATNVDWVYDLEQGLELAREQNKPVMVDFYADWCTVCKEIEAFTYTDDAVDEQLDRFVNIKVDIDRVDNREQIIERYQITGLPLIVFYDSLGEMLPEKRITGFINAENFVQHVEDIR
ncbi:MAG: thioredoxin family protein [bacterium]|jgi:thiol:disulfide interchange protein DsbD